MEQLLLHTDIEYGIILLILTLMFIFGMKPRGQKLPFRAFAIDLDMSTAIKGIACVMILMSHYGKRVFGYDAQLPLGLSKTVFYLGANIALVWFMFFSGYGLSLKSDSKIEKVGNTWLKRVWKIYGPYMLVTITALMVYVVLPERFSLQEIQSRTISPMWHYVKHLGTEFKPSLIYDVLIHSSWYVECILWFYSIWYLSIWLSRKLIVNKTTILCVLMLAYLVAAYYYYGPAEAHYYRYPCVFLLGHFVVTWKNQKWWDLVLGGCIILMNIAVLGMLHIVSLVIALVGILLFSLLNTRFIINGKAILLLGALSYYFYLSHVTISYTLLCYADVQSCLAWTVLSFVVALLLYKLGCIVFNRKKSK